MTTDAENHVPVRATDHINQGEATAFSLSDVHGYREFARRVLFGACWVLGSVAVCLLVWLVFAVVPR